MGKDFRGGRGGNRGGDRGRGKPNFSNRSMRGGKRGGVGNAGGRGKSKTIIEPHRFPGLFIAKSAGTDYLVTLNFAPGQTVYGEKKILVEDTKETKDGLPAKLEYRVWNCFRSKLAACIVNGIDKIYICPGAKVLYLGAASGTTISHVSDIVGESGVVYGVEISKRSGRDFTNMAKLRPNIVPIIEDGRKPWKYRFMMSMVDVIFADIAIPDQARVIAINAQYFLKNGGGFVFSIKASCVDSTAEPAAVFAQQIQELKNYGFKVKSQVTLEPFERDHCVVTGLFRPQKKEKTEPKPEE
ncbi:MAG: fibrillarin-like rRNA/tRNA 2'-O-methyltransferase [archaeon]|nr:fibrillarin-like rRNA/tRNA 2'-O-methyltransferase [archaeon]